MRLFHTVSEGKFSEVRLEKWPPGIYDPLRLGAKIRSIVKPGALWNFPPPKSAPRLFSCPFGGSWAAWTGARFTFAITQFYEVRLAPVAAKIPASQTHEGLSDTHHNLWRARNQRDMPLLARWAGVGEAPRAHRLTPAPQRHANWRIFVC
jgi:hypothetical protein